MFATISGAHLYGFPSADSDYDLRGVHLLPLDEVLGLGAPRETLEWSNVQTRQPGQLEMDLVTHDVEKFMRLMLKRNGYVLEQLFSPLAVHTTPEHDRLKAIGRGCVTRHHVHHYLGFARNQWNLFNTHRGSSAAPGNSAAPGSSDAPGSTAARPRVKPLLYVYRVLLTGIHLLRTGEVEANLLTLNAEFALPYIDELIARKAEGGEHSRLTDADLAFHASEFTRLQALLEDAGDSSTLPDAPTTRDDMNALLLELRLSR